MPKTEYTRVSREFLDRVLDSSGESYEPRGLFLCRQEIDGEEVWTAMRNENGEGLTEDFKSRKPAVRWLHGYGASEGAYWTPGGKKQGVRRLEKIITED